MPFQVSTHIDYESLLDLSGFFLIWQKLYFQSSQQCISIVSNTHAVTDLSNMHHYTYSTTPKLMTNTGTSRVMTSTKTPTSSPTSMPSTLTYKTTNLILTTKQSPPPTHTTKLPKPTHTTNPPTSSRTTTPLTSGTHASTTTELFGIPVVGKRGDRRKRFTSCEHCCRGDLCNNVCVHHSEFNTWILCFYNLHIFRSWISGEILHIFCFLFVGKILPIFCFLLSGKITPTPHYFTSTPWRWLKQKNSNCLQECWNTYKINQMCIPCLV